MSPSLQDAIQDAEVLLLLVNHTEFKNFEPAQVAGQTKARIAIDTVNGWNSKKWHDAGFQLLKLGVGK